MSLSEYIAELECRENQRKTYRVARPDVPVKLRRLRGIKAVLWDIYGTLFATSAGDLEESLAEENRMQEAFALTAAEFGMGAALSKLGGCPARVLLKMYVGEIEKEHLRKKRRGIEYPEVNIEEIWFRIITRLTEHGYKHGDGAAAARREFAIKVAYFFDHTLQRKTLYPGVYRTLKKLKTAGKRLGIISNAQFYTPMNLKRLLERQGRVKINDLSQFFDDELVFFSYQLGAAKPGLLAFRQAATVLAGYGIQPRQTLYVGNDLFKDVWCARQVGFRSALFAGDRKTLRMREDKAECQKLEPDAVVCKIPQVADLVS